MRVYFYERIQHLMFATLYEYLSYMSTGAYNVDVKMYCQFAELSVLLIFWEWNYQKLLYMNPYENVIIAWIISVFELWYAYGLCRQSILYMQYCMTHKSQISVMFWSFIRLIRTIAMHLCILINTRMFLSILKMTLSDQKQKSPFILWTEKHRKSNKPRSVNIRDFRKSTLWKLHLNYGACLKISSSSTISTVTTLPSN